MKVGKYIEKNNSSESKIEDTLILSSAIESNIDFSNIDIEKELKSVNTILQNSNDPEMIQYKKELEAEKLRREITVGSNVKNYFSELLKQKFMVNYDKRIVRFDSGEKYTFDEIERMKRNNYGPEDVRTLHLMKSKFKVKYIETEERFKEGLFA